MQDAKTVLEVINERGRKGLPLDRVYRQLFNREMYLHAYTKIAPNKGALTPGVTAGTADGMSLAKIDRLIEDLRHERHRWTPVRRIYIEKKNSTKKRPLGIPTWTDKLLQEVIRAILTAYYEPRFSDRSHGFRPNRGCHTALGSIERGWNGTIWFIEGDISGCFDNIDHKILLSILAERFHDGRFLRLIKELLEAGYLEDWKYNSTLSGTPQGGIVSPVLANIYLDRLDNYVENTLLPEYNHKALRKGNLAYERLQRQKRSAAQNGRTDEVLQLYKEMQQLPSKDTRDPEYRRLKYVRYADDFILGFAGPRAEAEQIKAKIQTFLSTTLKLEVSESKTLITHATTGAARFLGYDIHVARNDTYMGRSQKWAFPNGQRTVNGMIRLSVPEDVIKEKCQAYSKGGKPTHRPERMGNNAYSIAAQYQAEFRGLAEYYALAHNRSQRLERLKKVMGDSLALTLANKFKVSATTIWGRYAGTHTTPDGTYKVLKVIVPREGKSPLVAIWGGFSLARRPQAELKDQPQLVWNQRTELLERFLTDTCEICGSQGNVEVHHIHALRDLQTNGQTPLPLWKQWMTARRRTTLVLCRECHMDVQHGRPGAQR